MKRSMSAPLIPELLTMEGKAAVSQPATQNLLSRRVTSGSIVSLPGEIVIKTLPMDGSPRKQPMASPLSRSCINSPTSRQHRVEQLKKEENIDERRNEKVVQDQMMLSRSYDELRLDTEDQEIRPEQMEVWHSEPSPSHPPPSHQPLSPLASRMMRSRSLTPTSPSPNRPFSYRRSCSPVLRPSSLCFRVGRKRARYSESQEDMDISPGILNKRIQLGFPSPLNLSPSVSPLMGNSPLQHSFCTHSRKSSSTQSESTPLSSPSSLAHSTNPFAINYDSGNCEHWQSNSGSGSSCSSPSILHTMSNLKGAAGEIVSFGSQFKLQGGGGGLSHEDTQISNLCSLQGFTTGHHHSRLLSLSPSPSVVISEDHAKGAGMLVTSSIETSFPCSTSFDLMTETPTPLSPKGLQFRQKLFPPQSLPSPIPRPLPHSAPPLVYSSASCFSSGSLRGGIIASPMSPKSHHHHQQHSSPSVTSLHHDKHLSPFKSELAPGRMIRAVTKKKLSHLRQLDSMRGPAGPSGGGGGSISNDHFASSGCGTRIMNAHHPQNTNRQTINSPLATLSMSSSLEEGGGSGLGQSALCRSAAKRRPSEADSVARREESVMQSDGEAQCQT